MGWFKDTFGFGDDIDDLFSDPLGETADFYENLTEDIEDFVADDLGLGETFGNIVSSPWALGTWSVQTLDLLFSGPNMPDIPGGATSPTYAADQPYSTIKEGIPLPLVFGQCLVAGNIIRTNDPSETDIKCVVAYAKGPISSVSQHKVNDILFTELEGAPTKTDYSGTLTQTADARFTDKAQAYRGLAYTAYTFPKNKQISRVPRFTHVVNGFTCPTLADPSILAFTRNPAVILAYVYTEFEGYAWADLNVTEFQALETYCDEIPTGGTLPRYRFDFAFDTKSSLDDIKRVIFKSFNGTVVESQGQLKPVWEKARASVHDFTFDNIIQGSFKDWGEPEERPNVIRIYYRDAADDYKKTSVELRDDDDIAVNGEILAEERCWWITDAEIAKRRCQLKFDKVKYTNAVCALASGYDSGKLEVYDRVTVTHTLAGYSAKDFIIRKKDQDQFGRCTFLLEAYYGGIYHDREAEVQANYASDLPNPYQAPASSTNISAAMTAVGTAYDFDAVRVSFTPPAADLFYSYSEIYASNDDLTYYYIGRDGTGTFTFNALGVIYEPGDTCYIKIRSVNTLGIPEDLPAVASTSVLISSTMRLGGFYAGLTFFGDSATAADAKILLDKTNTLMRLGPTSGSYLVVDGDRDGEPAIYSSDYVSGVFGAGFLLKADLLEVGNIAARGIIRTAVFQKDVVSAVGGNLAVLPADLLNADMTADDDDDDFVRISEAGDTRISEAGDTRILEGYGVLTIEGNETFTAGDILRIKNGLDDEWMEVGPTNNAPIYAVVRDKAGYYVDGANPTWSKGASVINYGLSGDGAIYMTASETNAPYLSVFTHAGSPWSTINTRLRVGNLNGFLGYTTDEYGIAIGETSKYLKYDPTNGLRIAGEVGPITVSSSGYVKGGQTAYNTGAGFFLGYDVSAYKFSVGDPDNEKYIAFDGSDVLIGRDTQLRGSDAYNNDNIYFHAWPCESDEFYTENNGGTLTWAPVEGTVSLVTSNTVSASYVGISKGLLYNIVTATWDKNRRFKVKCFFGHTTFQTIYITMGGREATISHVGFKVVDGNLYGSTSDGTTEVNTLLMSIVADTLYTLEVIYTSGTSAAYYVDGVLKGTGTTGLPSGTANAHIVPYVRIINSEAHLKRVTIGEVKFLQEA